MFRELFHFFFLHINELSDEDKKKYLQTHTALSETLEAGCISDVKLSVFYKGYKIAFPSGARAAPSNQTH